MKAHWDQGPRASRRRSPDRPSAALCRTRRRNIGKRPGDVAHKTVKAQQQIGPKSELQIVDALLIGLEKLGGLGRELINRQ